MGNSMTTCRVGLFDSLWSYLSRFFTLPTNSYKAASFVNRCRGTSKGGFLDFFSFMYDIKHCFICRPSDSTVSEDAGIEPRAVGITALTVRRLDLIHTRLDLIHILLDLMHNSAKSHPHSARSHSHLARSHPRSATSHPHLARSHPLSARSHLQG